MPSCDNGLSFCEFGYGVDLKHRHDQINMQRIAASSTPGNDVDLTERKCQAAPFQYHTDSNRLLDDKDVGIDELIDIKCRRDVLNEDLKRQINGTQIFDLEQVQDSGLHSFESFQFSDNGTPLTKHLETSVKRCSSGAETSVKTNFDLTADFLIENVDVDSCWVKPALEKGSVEAESSPKKTGRVFVSDVPENMVAVPDVDKADLFQPESVLDLHKDEDCSTLLVDSCGVEPVLEETSLEAGSLATETVGECPGILRSKYPSDHRS